MGKKPHTLTLTLKPNNNDRLATLCGPLDQNIHHLAESNNITISQRGHVFLLKGVEDKVTCVARQLEKLYALTETTADLSNKDLHLARHSQPSDLHPTVYSFPQKSVQLSNARQRDYMAKMEANTVCFALGPSGTGKTFLAVAAATTALLNHSVSRIILARPAVDAGEKLGFLPGDMAQKVDPYLRPFYDALYELVGVEQTHYFIEKSKIEIAPLAFMRGRTLSEAFIILDEAQNTSPEQMKMLLTRLGHDSKMVITGDLTQVDLPKNQLSGLRHAHDILQDIDHISFVHFAKKDVVRHSLIQNIVDAYERQSEENHT